MDSVYYYLALATLLWVIGSYGLYHQLRHIFLHIEDKKKEAIYSTMAVGSFVSLMVMGQL